MRPTPAAIMAGTTRRVTKKVPRMLTSKTRSHSAAVTSRKSIGELHACHVRQPDDRRQGGLDGGDCRVDRAFVADVDGEAESRDGMRVCDVGRGALGGVAVDVQDSEEPSRRGPAGRRSPDRSRGGIPAPVTTAVRSVGRGVVHVSSSMAARRVSSWAGDGGSSATRGGPDGKPCNPNPALIRAISAPATASTARLTRSCAAVAACSSPRRRASARAMNGIGKTLETPEDAPPPPAWTKSPNSMSLPEYTDEALGGRAAYSHDPRGRLTADLRSRRRGNLGQLGELGWRQGR